MKKIVFFAFLLAAFSYFGHPAGPPVPSTMPSPPGETLEADGAVAADTPFVPTSVPAPETDGNDATDAAPTRPPGLTFS